VETLGKGRGVAALFNGRAQHVTPAVVKAFKAALPAALVLVSDDLSQARRHVQRMISERVGAVFCGGGDGAASWAVNLFRAQTQWLPVFGLLRLGTGNAWAGSHGARRYAETVRALRHFPRELPVRHQLMIEVEETLCPFAGVGWDAQVLNDYQRQRDRLWGSAAARWLHSGVGGYVYSVGRCALPSIWRGSDPMPTRMLLDRSFGLGYRMGDDGTVQPVASARLYEGPMGVAMMSTIPQHNFGIRAFPSAAAVPGQVNVRILHPSLVVAAKSLIQRWRGTPRVEGLVDLFASTVRLSFSRPMPFQIAGDPAGEREQIDLAVANEVINVLDWEAAFIAAHESSSFGR
jgi:diacylglycerol kinase family enzyme